MEGSVHKIWKNYPVYTGNDLGVIYSPSKTSVRIWAPTASKVRFNLYEEGLTGRPAESFYMQNDRDGTWTLVLDGDRKNLYYTIQAKISGNWNIEVPDPHAKAAGVNGKRGMITDLRETDPPGWENDRGPVPEAFTDMVIWEVHVRDFSIHPASGMKHKGKYLAFTESGTVSPDGESTGIDHLKELGVTHVHLLPVFDFATVDESKPDQKDYNWGYDPLNYNLPEGSYSTDPFRGNVRIKEFKEMVMSLHNNGIGVIMDVVYSHMYEAGSSPFEQLAPHYFFRKRADGSYWNGSGCGNETASERQMMRSFMSESLKYWAEEYHIDGFRFDLMGLHDIDTMNHIRKVLDKVNPGIFIYGEGWTASDSPLPKSKRAVKANAGKMDRIALFSDDIRDGIRGIWSNRDDKGFMGGAGNMSESVKFGVVAATYHTQIDYSRVIHSNSPWADSGDRAVSYVSCHDNPSLWDIITMKCRSGSKAERLDIQKLANAIVLTSQGVPFLHAGEEIARTKNGEHNTYNMPDHINQIDWGNKEKFNDVFSFFRDLVKMRKNHPAFRMTDQRMITEHLKFIPVKDERIIGFRISGNANDDNWKDILVYYSSKPVKAKTKVPAGEWIVVATKFGVNENGVDTPDYDYIIENSIEIPSRSILILVNEESI